LSVHLFSSPGVGTPQATVEIYRQQMNMTHEYQTAIQYITELPLNASPFVCTTVWPKSAVNFCRITSLLCSLITIEYRVTICDDYARKGLNGVAVGADNDDNVILLSRRLRMCRPINRWLVWQCARVPWNRTDARRSAC